MTFTTSKGPKYIGQRLNVCYRDVREAVLCRDGDRIVFLARQQVLNGAGALDLCCAGCDDETGALIWMAETVQAAVDVTLCLDSAASETLLAAAAVCGKPPIINAISIDHVRQGSAQGLAQLAALLWIVSTFDPDGPGHSPQSRLNTVFALMESLSGTAQSQLILDPLFLPSVTFPEAWTNSCETAELLRSNFPEAGMLCAVGNVSYGSRGRAKVDRDTIGRAVNNGFDWLLCDVANI